MDAYVPIPYRHYDLNTAPPTGRFTPRGAKQLLFVSGSAYWTSPELAPDRGRMVPAPSFLGIEVHVDDQLVGTVRLGRTARSTYGTLVPAFFETHLASGQPHTVTLKNENNEGAKPGEEI